MDTKSCKRCGLVKHIDQFYLNRGRPDAWCIECAKEAARIRGQNPDVKLKKAAATRAKYAADIEASRQKRRDRYARNVDNERAAHLKYSDANPHKKAAKNAVAIAVEHGAPRASAYSCSYCGASAQDYHHWSYEEQHWLSVIPACRRCHSRVHSGVITDSNPELRAVRLSNKEPENES